MPECRPCLHRVAPVGASFTLLVTLLLALAACPQAAAVDLPDPLYQDTNLDGIDGDIAAAVFVDPGGSITGDGSMSDPLRSINYAIGRAVELGKTQVLVAGGNYPELVRMADGVSLFGGYDGPPLWGRSAENETVISYGGRPLMPHVFVLEAVGITSPTVVEGFTITCGDGLNGRSSYGVRAFESPGLMLRHNIISAGDGGEGEKGFNGAAGADGGDGKIGGIVSCLSLYGGAGGAGGAGCSSGYRGGRGGAKGPYAGEDGEGYLFTPGGLGGDGGLIAEPGGSGWPGLDAGYDGHQGALGLEGTVVNGYWVPDTGGEGLPGGNGRGGAGGGGGGGYGCLSGLCGGNTPGNGGGGGGAGGCGGAGGYGGTGGGASLAVLATASGGMVISDCVLRAGNGGPGGAGGNGGPGGSGGKGGRGAVSLCLRAGWGGDGGDGGDGKAGGRGGAGAGGPSWAVLSQDGGLMLSGNIYSHGLPGGGPGSPGVAGAVRHAGKTLPMPDSMRLSRSRVAPGAQVQVTLNLLSSTSDVVMVNGVAMQKVAPQEWKAALTAPDEPGTYHVAASYGGYVYGGSFAVQSVLGVRGSQAEQVMEGALGRYLFRVWGQVSSRGGNTLEVTDGSGAVVRVTADAALLRGIGPGTFVIATGELDSQTQPVALQAHSVEKVEPEAVP